MNRVLIETYVPITFGAMTDTAQTLRDMVREFMDRTGIGPSRLSRLSVRSPGFIAEFLEGRMPRLDTADLLLKAMGLPPIGPRFRQEVREYLNVTGANRSALGQEALKDPGFVTHLLNGTSPELRTMDRVRDWIQKSTTAAERRKIETAVSAALSSLQDAGGAGQPVTGTPFFLDTKELAALLKVSEHTLYRYRCEGGGPEFHKLGRNVRYARPKVEAWVAKRNRSSTSDPGEEPPEGSSEASDDSTEDEQ